MRLRTAVATLVVRLSRQTLTVALPDGYNAHRTADALPDGYDAHRTADAVAGALSRQPRHMVKTLTWDQGREMARWQHTMPRKLHDWHSAHSVYTALCRNDR